MFTYLRLVLLLLFTDSLVPKFHFQLKKKKLELSGKWSDNLVDGLTALALLLYVLYSERARCFNLWQRTIYLNFIIISLSDCNLPYSSPK